jgi:hypothetical protein
LVVGFSWWDGLDLPEGEGKGKVGDLDDGEYGKKLGMGEKH